MKYELVHGHYTDKKGKEHHAGAVLDERLIGKNHLVAFADMFKPHAPLPKPEAKEPDGEGGDGGGDGDDTDKTDGDGDDKKPAISGKAK